MKNNLCCTLVLILAYLLTRNGCECQRGNSNIQYSHVYQNQNAHRRERMNILTNQPRQSRDSVANYRLYATKLTNPCGNAQRSIVKRASRQSDHEGKTINTFLNLAKQNLLPQNSLDLILSLAGVAKQLVEDQKKDEVRIVFHEKERNRRETEVDMEEFVLRRTELRNLLSGLQTLISQHIVQVNGKEGIINYEILMIFLIAKLQLWCTEVDISPNPRSCFWKQFLSGRHKNIYEVSVL